MKSILIADAGSTKIEWTLINFRGEILCSFITVGLNALLANRRDMDNIFNDVKEMFLNTQVIDNIYYYGAGCATLEICNKIEMSLRYCWKDAEIFVGSDLLAAARSLFGQDEGVACILGTGSNSCLYNGEKIVDHIPSLGYILGDEGSGAALGKRLLGDILKKQLPGKIITDFMVEYKESLPHVLDTVYRKVSPNRYLASFVPFLHKNLWCHEVYSLVLVEFIAFFKRNVVMYEVSNNVDIRFTGSVAFHFEKILKEAALAVGCKVTEVTEKPMQGLVGYHSLKMSGYE